MIVHMLSVGGGVHSLYVILVTVFVSPYIRTFVDVSDCLCCARRKSIVVVLLILLDALNTVLSATRENVGCISL